MAPPHHVPEDFKRLRASLTGILRDLGAVLGDLTAPQQPTSPRQEGCEDAGDDAAQRLIDSNLQHFWNRYASLKTRHEQNTLSCAVLALTKAGKANKGF